MFPSFKVTTWLIQYSPTSPVTFILPLLAPYAVLPITRGHHVAPRVPNRKYRGKWGWNSQTVHSLPPVWPEKILTLNIHGIVKSWPCSAAEVSHQTSPPDCVGQSFQGNEFRVAVAARLCCKQKDWWEAYVSIQLEIMVNSESVLL